VICRAITADTVHLFPEHLQVAIEGALDNGWPSLLLMLRDAPVDMSGLDALAWWRSLSQGDAERGNLFSSHIRAARIFLSLPAGGAPSEATFSSTTEVVTKKRNQLGDVTLEMMTVIRNFLQMPDFDLTKLIEEIGDDARAVVEAMEAVERAESDE